MERVFNFAPGPSMLPLPVLEQIQKELLCYGSTGMSVMEMSHRSKMYLDIFNQTVADLREVMAIPDHYKVIFPQGGATAMFAAVAMNLMDGGHADYVDSGNFAHNALVEAQKYGAVNVAGSSRAENYTHIPDYTLSPDAKYVHITTNNTIYGTRWDHIPDTGDVPLVADMSSNILSEVYDVRKFGVIYAGAQKNVAPAGVVILIVREDLLGRALPITHNEGHGFCQARRGGQHAEHAELLRHLRRGADLQVDQGAGRRRGAGSAQHRKSQAAVRLSGREQALHRHGAEA